MGTNEIEIRTRGDDAFENAREQLSAQEHSPDEVAEVHVRLVLEEDRTEMVSVARKLNRLRSLTVGEDQTLRGDRAYSILKVIQRETRGDETVTSAVVGEKAGMEEAASSAISHLFGEGLLERNEAKEGQYFKYKGLTELGEKELARLEAAMEDDCG